MSASRRMLPHRFVGLHAPPAGDGGDGGLAQGTALKSKKSSRFGWAASRAVRFAFGPINLLSTNLIIAV